MSTTPHTHGADCACHHPPRAPQTWWAQVLPALACAACPACMAVWKPLLSVIGVTLALSEGEHEALLYASLAVALAVGAWDLWRSTLKTPFVLTAVGAALMVSSHLAGDVAVLEWTGMVVMVASVFARWVIRARLRAAEATS